MTIKTNGCIFFEARTQTCTHKHNHSKDFTNKNRKRCRYKDITKCPYYMDWLEMKESIARMAKNNQEDY